MRDGYHQSHAQQERAAEWDDHRQAQGWAEQHDGGTPEGQGRERQSRAMERDEYPQESCDSSHQAPFVHTPGAMRPRDRLACQEDARAFHEEAFYRNPAYDDGRSPSRRAPDSELAGKHEVTHGRRPHTSSNAYANGSNQNAGNVLTDVPTTRVLKPPGGASHLSLGWEEDRSPPRREQQRSAYQHEQQRSPAPQRDHRFSMGEPQRSQDKQDFAFGQRQRVSSNTFARGANQNCGNVISDTPTTRVLRPPGGTSSLRLG